MDDKKLIKIDDILFYIPNPNDFIYAKMIETKRLWDIDRIRYMLNFVSSNSIVIDAGAHVGCHTIQFAKKAKKVIAIEPIKQNYDLLQINLKLNNLSNCQLIKKALSNNNSDRLVIDHTRERLNTNSGATYLIQSELGTIETITLDKLLENEKSLVSFIKYDVEEMEYEALQGSIKTLRKHKPALYVELIPDGNRNKRKDNNSQIISLLKVLGYKETEIIGVWKNKNG